MINKDTLIKVINKDKGTVGYSVPELGVNRSFYEDEEKEIPFEELQKLSYLPGGEIILKEFLEITDEEAYRQLFFTDAEPEYHYTKADIKKLMEEGTLDQFLDCLDFAPEGIKDTIKDLAVQLPLNDMRKRDAILEKLNFNVTRAIEIKNTKYDSGEEDTSQSVNKKGGRRAAPIKKEVATPTGRRYTPTNK